MSEECDGKSNPVLTIFRLLEGNTKVNRQELLRQ